MPKPLQILALCFLGGCLTVPPHNSTLDQSDEVVGYDKNGCEIHYVHYRKSKAEYMYTKCVQDAGN